MNNFDDDIDDVIRGEKDSKPKRKSGSKRPKTKLFRSPSATPNTIRIAQYGTGGHASVIAEVISRLNLKVQARYEDDFAKCFTIIDGVSVQPGAKVSESSEFTIKNFLCTISIGNNAERKVLAQRLHCDFLTLVDPSACVSESSSIGKGTVVLHRAIVQANSQIGRHVIVNTSASIDHDNIIEDFAHIAPNATLCGNVQVGEGALVGAGAVVLPQINIGKWATIGAGAIVTKDVPSYCTVVGNPAKIVTER